MNVILALWAAMALVAAGWGGLAGVPIWLGLGALIFAILPTFVGIFIRGALSPARSAELVVGLFVAAATAAAASTGGASSPLIVLFAAAVALAWLAGRPRLFLEASLFSALGYALAALAAVGGAWLGPLEAAALAGPYALAGLILLAATGVLALQGGGPSMQPVRAEPPGKLSAGDPSADRLAEANARIARAEAQLDFAAAEAAAAKRALETRTRFFAQTSHELRTPLNAIIGFAEMMTNAVFGPLPPKYAEYAGLIHDGGRNLELVVDDVLDLSRIEAGRYEIRPEPVSLTDLAEDAARFMGDLAARKHVHLAVESDGDVEAFADSRAVRQIALNLISNALKFTPEGGRVTVSATASGAGALLAVSDTGVGIGQDELVRLSRAFEQGEEGRKHKGAGLGLSVVRVFAELHGGRLDIESREGGGSTIAVFFPCEPA